jgi:maltooligosyltrehalose trehalohydrolase
MPGATVTGGGVAFRVWAPQISRVEVIFSEPSQAPFHLLPDGTGFHSGLFADARAGALYRYRLDEAGPFPDPYSRFQPSGPHGPSMVVDPRHFEWTDAQWPGLRSHGQVIYELHVGAATTAGTFTALRASLARIKELGVTCIELMPVAEFAGRWGWGYDGVDLFAPFHHDGTPDELRELIDRAHNIGLGVILDVVYNHVGADGNYLPGFAKDYFTTEHGSEWGETLNYCCEPVRRFAIDNAAYWIREFHFDGLRLDATQNIHDPQYPKLLATLSTEARAAAASRTIILSAEDHLQRADLVKPVEEGGAGLDHLWNDDFHHAGRVAVTGTHSGYFCNYRGHPQELLSTLKHGFLFQGQHDAWLQKGRGTSTRGIPKSAFVVFTQNHDQVANTLCGRRLGSVTSPGRNRALTAMLLLGPQTPLIFMGQEVDTSQPFPYFADYRGAVAEQLWANRKQEIRGFEQYATPAAQLQILDPCAPETFQLAKLSGSDAEAGQPVRRLYQDLLALRRRGDDSSIHGNCVQVQDGAVLNEHAFFWRWFDSNGHDRLLLINLGTEVDRRAYAEPLLAAPAGRSWRLHWSSEDPRYGGLGGVDPVLQEGWYLQAESASLLIAG